MPQSASRHRFIVFQTTMMFVMRSTLYLLSLLLLWAPTISVLATPEFTRQLDTLLSQASSFLKSSSFSPTSASFQYNGQNITFAVRDFGSNMSRYIVKLKDDTPDGLIQTVRLALQALGIQIQYDYSFMKAFSIYSSTPYLPVKELSKIPFIDYIERDFAVGVHQVQSPTSWGLDRIDQPSNRLDGNFVFDATGKNVNVYTLDSGVDTKHNEFDGRAQLVYVAPSFKDKFSDCTGHGTHVAGIIAGTNVGVAKQANIFSLRVIGCDDDSVNTEVVRAIQWVVDNHKKPAIINMSLGPKISLNGLYPRSEALDSAITVAINSGITVIAAAGNDNADACSGTPAGTTNVITVGATDQTDSRAKFSNFGKCVSIFAPGFDIVSAAPNNGYTRKEGTSQATPFVTGIAALFLEKNPNASPGDVARAILSSAKPVVKDTKGSSVLMAQLTSIPERGSPGYNSQLVKLASPGTIPFEQNSNFIAGVDNKYVYIGSGIAAAVVLLIIIYCCFFRKRNRNREKPIMPEPVSTRSSRRRAKKSAPVEHFESVKATPLNSPARPKRHRELEESFFAERHIMTPTSPSAPSFPHHTQQHNQHYYAPVHHNHSLQSFEEYDPYDYDQTLRTPTSLKPSQASFYNIHSSSAYDTTMGSSISQDWSEYDQTLPAPVKSSQQAELMPPPPAMMANDSRPRYLNDSPGGRYEDVEFEYDDFTIAPPRRF